MTTIVKSIEDKFSPSCPVLGTECGQILVLDPHTYTVIQQVLPWKIMNTVSSHVFIDFSISFYTLYVHTKTVDYF